MSHCTDCRSDQHDSMGARVHGVRQRCLSCNKFVDGDRVYFGVAGPFCCVPCRDRWAVPAERESTAPYTLGVLRPARERAHGYSMSVGRCIGDEHTPMCARFTEAIEDARAEGFLAEMRSFDPAMPRLTVIRMVGICDKLRISPEAFYRVVDRMGFPS